MVQFRNFHPKDEKWQKLYEGGVSVAHLYKQTEAALNAAIAEARAVQPSKEPLRPQWDLKKMHAERNKSLDKETLRAISRLVAQAPLGGQDAAPLGEQDIDMEDSTVSHRHRVLSFDEELSEDEDLGLEDAKRMMRNLDHS